MTLSTARRGGPDRDRHAHGDARLSFASFWRKVPTPIRWSLAYVVITVLIALASVSWRGNTAGTCAQDGQRIVPEMQVDLQTLDGQWHRFCSIVCAQRWLAHRAVDRVQQAIVRDALTGKPLDADVAFFVRSPIVSNPANGNNIHAFQYRIDAADHMRRFGGHEIDPPFFVE